MQIASGQEERQRRPNSLRGRDSSKGRRVHFDPRPPSVRVFEPTSPEPLPDPESPTLDMPPASPAAAGTVGLQLVVGYFANWVHMPVSMPFDTIVIRMTTTGRSLGSVLAEANSRPFRDLCARDRPPPAPPRLAC